MKRIFEQDDQEFKNNPSVNAEYDINVIPTEVSTDDVVKALSDINNYGIYISNMRNQPIVNQGIEKYFGNWIGSEPTMPKFDDPIKNNGNQVYFINNPGAVQSVIKIAFPIAMRNGSKDNLKMNVLNDVFGGGGFGTRLMQNLREDKAYTYGCYSGLNIEDNGGWVSAGGNFRNAVTDSAITQILMEFNRLNA